jgi:cytochrome c oxidase cbb3-type subunit 2
MIDAIQIHLRELSVPPLLFTALILNCARFAPASTPDSQIERGRRVYLSEGCNKCHSRNGLEHQLASGDDRQGPDLAQVGLRRSPLWLKMHFYNPREVSGVSIMPKYATLFRDGRGNDLVAYLSSLDSGPGQRTLSENSWRLSSETIANADPAEGPHLYDRFCATCHNPHGRTHIVWNSSFIEQPAVLGAGVFKINESASTSSQIDHVAHIIKFGIPDSDMAGHENMPDRDIASLSLWLTRSTAASAPHP